MMDIVKLKPSQSPFVKIDDGLYVKKSEVLAVEWTTDGSAEIKMKHGVVCTVFLSAEEVMTRLENKCLNEAD